MKADEALANPIVHWVIGGGDTGKGMVERISFSEGNRSYGYFTQKRLISCYFKQVSELGCRTPAMVLDESARCT